MRARHTRGRNVHGILLLDKAGDQTSNRALQHVKRLYCARKAGHTGTLDPLATGMLPVCLGEATKVSHYLLDADKEYLAGARFGSTTDTADRDGSVINSQPLPNDFSEESLKLAIKPFVGEIVQIPPMYSALKHEGKRLYELARKGETVQRKARQVTIFNASLESLEGDLAMIRVRCSKGTYIRTLIEDIGAALGCGAHIDSLRRVSVTPFDASAVVESRTLLAKLTAFGVISPTSDIAEATRQLQDAPSDTLADVARAIDEFLLPIDHAIKHLPSAFLDSRAAKGFYNGQQVEAEIAAGEAVAGQSLRVYVGDGEFVGIAELPEATPNRAGVYRITPKRVLNL